jgi:hypothetical protein
MLSKEISQVFSTHLTRVQKENPTLDHRNQVELAREQALDVIAGSLSFVATRHLQERGPSRDRMQMIFG